MIRVLLVEDDRIDQRAFERTVQEDHLPYDYTIANTASQAAQLLAHTPFDAIVSDYMLVDGTALDVLLIAGKTPVIVVTGAGNEAIAVAAMKTGAYDYIIKDRERGYLRILPITIEKALRRRAIEQAEQEQRTLAEALRDAALAMNSTLELDEVLNRILISVGRVVPHDRANIMLLEDDMAHIVHAIGWPETINPTRHPVRFQFDLLNTLRQMYLQRQPCIIPIVADYPHWVTIDSLPVPAAHLGAPLCIGDRIIGFINLDSDQPERYTPLDAEWLMAFASQAAFALDNAQLYQQAKELAAIHERQRLARELHDSVTQTLFSASMIADSVLRIWERSPMQIRDELIELRDMTRGALVEMRSLLIELRPRALVESDLADLLKQHIDMIRRQANIPVQLDVAGHMELPAEVQIAFFRIAQEAMNNIVKHAQASSVEVMLKRSTGQIYLSIADDGRGFLVDDIPANHYGLNIMYERAHSAGIALDIQSAINQGTRISAHWPIREVE